MSIGIGRIIYWPGSPWGGENSTDRTIGDVHQWNGENTLTHAFILLTGNSMGRHRSSLPKV